MTQIGLAYCLAAGILGASSQIAVPPASEVTLRRQIYRGEGVTAYLLRIPPGQGTQMHRHDKDILTVFISGGRTTAVFEGSAPTTDALAAGTVRYRSAGFAHSTRNEDQVDFRAVLLEFETRQGPRTDGAGPPQVFCTIRFCVDDVTLQPGEKLQGSGRGLFVPVAAMTVREASGRRHRQPSGSIWAGPRGWTNASRDPARVIAVTFR